jgi:uncharacterized membrane protein YgdD (TMEM256/DUF423 family)
MNAIAACGAFGCAIAVALGAYAMHATLAPQDHERLAIASLFLFAHGLALSALAPGAQGRLRRMGLRVVLAGTILFAGSLVLAALAGIAPVFAPFGGSLLILGWVLVASGFLTG